MDEIKAYYDAASRSIADEWYGNPVLIPTLDDYLTQLPPSPRILDLGCGPGYESKRLQALGAEVVGVDYSPENIRIARERCPQCEFHELDFRQLDSRFGLFDGIFACASLIHVAPSDLPGVAARMRSVLKADGRLLTLMLDGEGRQERRKEINGKEMHWWKYLYTTKLLQDLLSPFAFLHEGILADELREKGWRCCLWRLPPD